MSKLTQLQQVRNHLNIFKSITTWDAYEKYKITRLAHYVGVLKKTMAIKSFFEGKGNKQYKRYYIQGYEKKD